jgi:hypothetical protein
MMDAFEPFCAVGSPKAKSLAMARAVAASTSTPRSHKVISRAATWATSPKVV